MALAYIKENALNAICPYFTMFPLEYPNKVLRRHYKQRPVVLDPFCGRGTTLFAARNHKLNAWGIDTSPVAVAIAKAKLASCDKSSPIELAAKILAETSPKYLPETEFFRSAYHHDTLRDICALREALTQLDQDDDASVVLRAAILGCLHGPLPKNLENAGYLSNQMPRTYSSKPDYAVRFWKERNLKAPKIDLLRVLRRKVERLQGLADRSPNSFNQVLQGDARLSKTYKVIGASPSIVITSPPYYGMRTYLQDQWLRNWFLGGPEHVDYAAGAQIGRLGQASFIESLGSVWKRVHECASASDSLHMYVRFGIIPSAVVNAKSILRNSLEESGAAWRLVSVRPADSANAGKRQANQMKAESAAAIEFDFHVKRT